jgi:hypothetical protein
MDFMMTQATAGSSGSGLTVGTTNSATYWVALNTYTANQKKVHTLAARVPAGTNVNNLDFIIDPDTANFTGTISFEVHFAVTEGNP